MIFFVFCDSVNWIESPTMLIHESKEKLLPSLITKPSKSDFYTIDMAEFVDAVVDGVVSGKYIYQLKRALKKQN